MGHSLLRKVVYYTSGDNIIQYGVQPDRGIHLRPGGYLVNR